MQILFKYKIILFLLFLLCLYSQTIVPLFLPLEKSEMFRHFVLTTKTFQPRPQAFSVNCLVFWQQLNFRECSLMAVCFCMGSLKCRISCLCSGWVDSIRTTIIFIGTQRYQKMYCTKCRKEKLRREFPSRTLTDKCNHAPLHCLRVSLWTKSINVLLT